jgi:hypothetical protein
VGMTIRPRMAVDSGSRRSRYLGRKHLGGVVTPKLQQCERRSAHITRRVLLPHSTFPLPLVSYHLPRQDFRFLIHVQPFSSKPGDAADVPS